ncbi:MAG: bifunctional phosphoribosylaminoimidazolecarboxamide formyltransferase/inosine monophosphate cyclohydrolase, partial [Candidatus Omnitrophica bacterium CG11_big_fil_rev_8_21_14_0_20_64_10]
VASAGRLPEAFRKAHAGDPISAFGGIVGLNRPVDGAAARAILKAGFLECVAAPRFTSEGARLLKVKKNLRLVEMPLIPPYRASDYQIKPVSGGLLVQESDRFRKGPAVWKRAAGPKPTAARQRDLLFAWTVARFVRSNAIVVVKGEQAVGIGGGQTSRVDAVRIALKQAGKKARGAVLASDGFFPKPDGPAAAVRAGIRAIVQPGGSVQDPAVVAVARRAGITMLLTGERHFQH